MKEAWKRIACSSKEVQLMGTLDGGQSFRWRKDVESDTWTGVFSKTVWKLKQENDALLYQIVGSLLNLDEQESARKPKRSKKFNTETKSSEDALRNYLRLDVKLSELYADWSKKDELFKRACKQFYGIRMLAQEPVENLFSFICSQNNHISRITGLVEKLCEKYGEEICRDGDTTYYAFPDIHKLAHPKVEKELRELGFGYRARFIQQSAAQLVSRGGEEWLRALRTQSHQHARAELMQLTGIGPKVSDCICLMSLEQLGAVPVDTHVYQIACHHYLPHLRGKKSITHNMYAEIAQHFRTLYGPLAGWAHTVLFCADLKKFQQDKDEAASAERPNKR